MVGFIFGKGQAYATPEELRKARSVANALLMQQSAPKDIGSGLNSIGQALLYRSLMNKADASEKAGIERADAASNPVIAALGGASAFPPAPSTAGSNKVADALAGKDSSPNNYRDAIASIESAGSGDYGAVGPTNKKLGRALGRYQIMEANIGPWSKEALGREVTPDEFMADPKLQDTIFDHKFGSYVQQYGNPQDAASMWFTGKPAAQGANRRDVLGTTGSAYVSKFNQALGSSPAVAANDAMASGRPVQVASLDPSAGMSGVDPYSNIPAVDGMGQDQRAKFRAWNSDPRANEAANMQQIDPAMQAVIQRAKQIAGADFVIGSGMRNADQQRLAVQNGWSGTMDSDHLTGGAADLWPVDAQGRVNFDPRQQQRIVAAMKQAAGELGVDMDAGADWRKKDMPHFGMVGQTPMNGPIPQARPGVQVASNDPSIGMTNDLVQRQDLSGMQGAVAPIPNSPSALASVPTAGLVNPVTASPVQMQPGPLPNASPQQAAFMDRMTAPQSMTGGAPMPMQGMPSVQPSPQPQQQVAQAQQPDPAMARLPATAGGTADTFDAAKGPSLQMLYNALQEPWLSDTQKALITGEIQRQQQANDPLRQLQIQKAQRDLAIQPKQWQKLDDNTLFDPASGEIKQIGGGAASGQFRFEGKSVEAQALNGLMDAGTLTPAQAQQLGAGKTITDPSTGAIIFMTPQGVFGQPAQGGPAQPITPTPQGQPQTAPQGAPDPQQALSGVPGEAPTGAPPAGSPDGRQGMIPLTNGRGQKLTEAQQRNMQLYQVVQPELGIVEENFKALSNLTDQALAAIPGGTNYGAAYMQSPQYQRASNSLKTIIASYLYSTSGATANPGEVENQASILTPKPGESQASIDDKLNRIRTMVSAIKTATGQTATDPTDASRTTPSGLKWSIEP